MKTRNTIHRASIRPSWMTGFTVLAGLVICGLLLGIGKLRELYLEQCVLRDFDRQITIHTGEMVRAEVIAGIMGLKPGVNLAEIDYAKKRADVLKAIPNLRNIRFHRQLPDGLTIDAEERIPVARLLLKNQSKNTGMVVDSEGIAFRYFKKTQLLPIIREAGPRATPLGLRVTDAARAAIVLIDTMHDPEFQSLGLLEIDATHPDYLLVTVNTGLNYSLLKLAWEGMFARPTPASHTALTRQLVHFKQALASPVGSSATLWNATEPGRVYAKPKGRFR